MTTNSITALFHIDSLAILMMGLVGFIGLAVASFASRYIKGDTQYNRFFVTLAALVIAVMVMVSADHLLILLAAWGMSNALLVKLMIHKPGWRAAKASGVLTAKTYLLGFACIAGAFGLLYTATGETSVQAILYHNTESALLLPALILILIGAMTQSAIWPFHKWLTSSLNSPTPVSAIMHAGLVNGGGFLLARFAPLYFDAPMLLTVIFVLGLASALTGTLWKLMQSDVKRMLACSTMGQMGFMLAQCGLGLFPAAVAHLIWHGLFKAYLFLASGAAAQEKRLDMGYPPSTVSFICALLCGVIGSYGFAVVSSKSWLAQDTTLLLVMIAFVAASQFALTMLRTKALFRLPLVLVATGIMGGAYGLSVHVIESILTPLGMMQPQPLNAVHIAGMIGLAVCWLGILFGRSACRQNAMPQCVLHLYVKALNASQPHATTITTHRNHYQYL